MMKVEFCYLGGMTNSQARGGTCRGGVLRFKEKLEDRVKKVAETEIGIPVEYDPTPIDFNQIVLKHDTRGHFLSILYQCRLNEKNFFMNKGMTKGSVGFLNGMISAQTI